MAIPNENFDALNDGDTINGTSGGSGWSAAWSGYAGYKASSLTAQSGSICLRYPSTESTEQSISRTWTSASTSGVIRFALRRKGGNNWRDGIYIYLYSGATAVATVYMRSNSSTGGAELWWYYGTTEVAFATGLNADQWYVIDLEFDCSTDQYRVRYDEGSYTSWQNFGNNSTVTNVDKTLIFNGNINGGTYNVTTDHYFDSYGEFTPTYTKSITDTSTPGESMSLLETSYVSKSDTLNIGESISKILSVSKSVTDSVSIGELVTTYGAFILSQGDSITVGDAVNNMIIDPKNIDKIDSISTNEFVFSTASMRYNLSPIPSGGGGGVQRAGGSVRRPV